MKFKHMLFLPTILFCESHSVWAMNNDENKINFDPKNTPKTPTIKFTSNTLPPYKKTAPKSNIPKSPSPKTSPKKPLAPHQDIAKSSSNNSQEKRKNSSNLQQQTTKKILLEFNSNSQSETSSPQKSPSKKNSQSSQLQPTQPSQLQSGSLDSPELFISQNFRIENSLNVNKEFYDSRSYHQSLKFNEVNFTEWHQGNIDYLSKLTDKVRVAIAGNYPPNPTNLLKYKASLFFEEKTLEIEEPNIIWLSGGETSPKKKRLNEVKRTLKVNEEFKFITSNFTREQIIEDISRSYKNYSLLNQSCLISQRLKCQKKNLERAKVQQTGHLDLEYYHTEQAVILHITSEAFFKTVIEKIKEEKNLFLNITSTDLVDLVDLDELVELSIVVNMASIWGVCMNCGDRLLRISEQSETIFQPLAKKIEEIIGKKCNLKIHFLVSSKDPYPDNLKKENKQEIKEFDELVFLYCSSTLTEVDRKKFGFYNPTIKFLVKNDLNYRQRFDKNKPLIGQTLFEVRN